MMAAVDSYEGKVKNSRPSLCETWDKQQLVRESDRCCDTEYDKTFLITSHNSMGIRAAYGQGEKFPA